MSKDKFITLGKLKQNQKFTLKSDNFFHYHYYSNTKTPIVYVVLKDNSIYLNYDLANDKDAVYIYNKNKNTIHLRSKDTKVRLYHSNKKKSSLPRRDNIYYGDKIWICPHCNTVNSKEFNWCKGCRR